MHKCCGCCAQPTDETNVKMEMVHQIGAMEEESLKFNITIKPTDDDALVQVTSIPSSNVPTGMVPSIPFEPVKAPIVETPNPTVAPEASPEVQALSLPSADAQGHKPGSEYTAVLDLSGEERIGLSMVLIDQNTVTVGSLKNGAATVWNEMNSHSQIRAGDRVVSVNTLTSANEMLETTRTEKRLVFVLRRPLEFTVIIQKKPGSQHLGMRCAHDGMTVMVAEVLEGPAQDWNNRNKGQEVITHDRIIEVNGSRADAEVLLKLMQSSERLELVIFRTT